MVVIYPNLIYFPYITARIKLLKQKQKQNVASTTVLEDALCFVSSPQYIYPHF